ncbi:hypothetical protein Asp14428_18760 [Actinoplanes sp. NBRC 14428]|nr:hypothetical protein Asp14428_18760 [Actinoplanes sp. NBRC 14428]
MDTDLEGAVLVGHIDGVDVAGAEDDRDSEWGPVGLRRYGGAEQGGGEDAAAEQQAERFTQGNLLRMSPE